MKTMKLTPQQFIDLVINQDTDLYNPTTEQYVFHYNENGAIMVYNLTPEEAKGTARYAVEESNGFWGGLLGPGGWIYDEPLDFLDTDSFEREGWITCDDYAKEVLQYDNI